MNPKPLLALNHFTVPCSFTSFSLFLVELFDASRPESLLSLRFPLAVKQKRLRAYAHSPFTLPKVKQEQQTQKQTSTIGRFAQGEFFLVLRAAGLPANGPAEP